MTAVLSLAGALFFNGRQLRENGRQQRATREATEVQLLTQVNGVINDATLRISGVLDRTNKPHVGLSQREEALLDFALNDFDYVAWLFENRFLALPAAQSYWTHELVCAYQNALLLERRRDLERKFPSLARYKGRCE